MATRKEKKQLWAPLRVMQEAHWMRACLQHPNGNIWSFEPAWFHQRPREFTQEFVKSYYGKSIIDFSPHSGPWAMAALAQRLTYAG